MIDYLIFDEVDRIIELGLFDDLKPIFKYLLKDVIMPSKIDKDFERLKEVRDEVMFNGVKLKIYDEKEVDEESALNP